MLPADHIIENRETFTAAVQLAVPSAEAGSIATFGVVSNSLHEGYGYINAAELISEGFGVVSFKEKPCPKTAKEYLNIGGYYWNSGIYLLRAGRCLQ